MGDTPNERFLVQNIRQFLVDLKTFEWTDGQSFHGRDQDLSWPHQVKMGSFLSNKKHLKLGYYMDTLRFFVWIILNYWIMIIFDPFTLPCQLAKCYSQGFSHRVFRWENPMTCLSRRELRSRMRAEARSKFSMKSKPVDPGDFALDVGIFYGCFPYSKMVVVSPKHLKMILFSRKTPWVCWGNPPF